MAIRLLWVAKVCFDDSCIPANDDLMFSETNLPTERRHSGRWELILYIDSLSQRSQLARRAVQQVCDEHLEGCYSLEVVDLQKAPQLVIIEPILAVPMLVRNQPGPKRTLIGNLADPRRVLISLGLA